MAEKPSDYALGAALRWVVRDGRAHGVSVCMCPSCVTARHSLERFERWEADEEERDRNDEGSTHSVRVVS